MPIKDLTDRVRPPRLGKIRIGEKAISPKGKEYPVSRDYFVCPVEVKDVCGEKPKELDVMFLSDDIEDVFPTYYKMYGQTSGLKCRGDGITANKLNKTTGNFEEIDCPGQECPDYEAKRCRRIGALKFLLPKVNGIGIWEIDTSSYNSILNIYSMIGSNGLIRALTKGRIRMIPFKLAVERREVQAGEKMQTVSVLELRCDQVNLGQLMNNAHGGEQLPKTKDIKPAGKPESKPLLGKMDPEAQILDYVSEEVKDIIFKLTMCKSQKELLEKVKELLPRINKLTEKEHQEVVREAHNIEVQLGIQQNTDDPSIEDIIPE